MEWINQIIKNVGEAGLSQVYYAGWNSFATYGALLFCCLLGRKYKINLLKLLAAAYLMIQLLGEVAGVILWAQNGFQSNFAGNFIVVFVYAPLVAWLFAKVFRIPWNVMTFFSAAICMILHGFYRIGCTFAGCCQGITTSWGLYNSYLDQICFPVQPLEALLSFGIAGYLVIREKRNGYAADWRAMPIALIAYGTGRFVLEFFHDNEKLLLGCSDSSFHSLFMCIVGIVWLVMLKKKQKENQAPVSPGQT